MVVKTAKAPIKKAPSPKAITPLVIDLDAARPMGSQLAGQGMQLRLVSDLATRTQNWAPGTHRMTLVIKIKPMGKTTKTKG